MLHSEEVILVAYRELAANRWASDFNSCRDVQD